MNEQTQGSGHIPELCIGKMDAKWDSKGFENWTMVKHHSNIQGLMSVT
jgi:hypothetical protein